MPNSSSDFFSPNYHIAKQRFCHQSTELGWQQESYFIKDDLSIDITKSPYSSDRPTIIISSGLHGGEGFFGSAVQLALLESGNLTTNINWVFLHALNPYGFANLRRCNENNVDLNRNFLLPGEKYQGSSPIYGKISPILNPERIGKITSDARGDRSIWITKHLASSSRRPI
jgi:murein tripeptide amidase MpaA